MFLQPIRIISEASCDTEDWSNDALFISEINYILKYIHIENNYFSISQYYCFLFFIK